MGKRMESPEEGQRDSGDRPSHTGSGPFDGGGIEEGKHGRGATPYLKSHSSKPGGYGLAAHAATAGRGGSGILGKGDDFKGRHTAEVGQPDSHAGFEALGTDTE